MSRAIQEMSPMQLTSTSVTKKVFSLCCLNVTVIFKSKVSLAKKIHLYKMLR